MSKKQSPKTATTSRSDVVYHESACRELLCDVLRQVHRDINHDYEYAQPSKKYDAVMARESAKRFLDSPEFEILCGIIGIKSIKKVKQKCLS